MTANPERASRFSFEDAERAQLLAWIGLSAGAKIEFFEEMIELAYHSGALSSERLALRDGALSNLSMSRSR
jgi:tagatose-1,6-bisphosphate aldolase